jgi:hypothetical protein
LIISVRQILSFLRWRLVPVRYAGRLRYLRPKHLKRTSPSFGLVAKAIQNKGFTPGPIVKPDMLSELQATFKARAPEVRRADLKVPFVNLTTADDFTVDSAFMKLAFSPDLLDPVLDYFGGQARLDSLQVLYSFPSNGPLKESQKWHLDYGDSKSMHCVMYLNDVVSDAEGPFTFVDKKASKSLGRSLIVRRIPDEQMEIELKGAEVHKFYGPAGSSVWIDPAACYHYGSRCVTPRTAIFLTYNSETPFTAQVPLVRNNAKKIANVGKKLRPDLPAETFDRLLGL